MKVNIILAVIGGAALAAIIVFLNIRDDGSKFTTQDTVAVGSEPETTTAQRKKEDGAVITIVSEDKGYRGHVESDFFVIDYCNIDEDVISVPETIQGYTVKKLSKLSFARRFCKEIILPDSIEEIGERAFINCEELEKITLGKGLKKIGMEALKSCHALKSVTFPEKMTEIADTVFSENENLGDIGIPGKDTKIGVPVDITTCTKAVIVTPEGSQADKTAKEKKIPVRN